MNNSATNLPYVVDIRSIDPKRLHLALSDIDVFLPSKIEKKWYLPLRKLPKRLQSALLSELELGNQVTSIQFGNWPQAGSVLVCLAAPFKNDYSTEKFGVCYRVVNDPHYWMAEISVSEDGVEYLIVV
jgi:hypothetical protein